MICSRCNLSNPHELHATDCPIFLAKLLGHRVTLGHHIPSTPPVYSDTPLRVTYVSTGRIELKNAKLAADDTWIVDPSLETLTIVTTGPASIPHGPHDDSERPRYLLKEEIPEGAQLTGLAPVGVRWAPGGIWRRGVACPAGRWPKRIARSEFVPTSALVDDEWIPIRH